MRAKHTVKEIPNNSNLTLAKLNPNNKHTIITIKQKSLKKNPKKTSKNKINIQQVR